MIFILKQRILRMYEREIHKWTDGGKPISPAFGQNYGSIKCSLKEKTNNLVAS